MPTTLEFLQKLGIKYQDVDLYDKALTHSSYANNKGVKRDYERLEFIGDSVLNFVIASLAYDVRKDLDQGGLTKLRIALVQSQALIKVAKFFNLQDYIKLGNGLKNEELSHHERILEDVVEAIFGAIFIDSGYEYCRIAISRVFMNLIISFKEEVTTDYKSCLQEAVQSEYRKTVFYKLIEEKGPSHDPTFKVQVLFNDLVLGEGTGHSKKEAEQNAAKDALAKKAV